MTDLEAVIQDVTTGHKSTLTERPISGDLRDTADTEGHALPKSDCDASQIAKGGMPEPKSADKDDDLQFLADDTEDLWRWRSVGGGRFARMMGSGQQRKILKVADGHTSLTYVSLEDLSDERRQRYYTERASQGQQRAALGRGWKSDG